MQPLAGVYAAAVTPLKTDFSPDMDSIPPLLDFLARRGCHGMLLLGTTGEGPSFSAQERLEIFRAGARVRETHPTLRQAQGGAFRLLAGTGTPSLTETVALTRGAFDLGCDGVVVLPPYYYRKTTDAGLFAWFSELIHRAVPADGALLGYHIPGMTGIGFSLDLLARLKNAFPRQFAGLKDSSHDPDFAHALGERFGADLLVLTGTDSYLQLAMENRAGGCITAPANLISPDLRRVWDGLQNGEDVSAAQERVTEIRRLLEKYPPFPPLLKALLAKQHGFPRWPVRPPLESVEANVVEQVMKEMERLFPFS
ncbi:MAG: dihydrodipicolinate synthase family protein [Chloroflexi bacterium]|nr:dihydrodipicolinate synthase family protein [Chloroflexota bacterium]